jgi:hypothetical protein
MVHFRYEWFDSLEGTKIYQQLSEYKQLSEEAGLLTIRTVYAETVVKWIKVRCIPVRVCDRNGDC